MADHASTLEALQLSSFGVLLTAKLGDAGIGPARSLQLAGEILQAAQAAPHYYPHNMNALIRNLNTPHGDMLERTIAGALCAGELRAADVPGIDLEELARQPDSRRVGRAHIYSKLAKNKMEDATARQVAVQIERSIYNQAIDTCSYREITQRSWDNPGFVGIYSGRITTISLYLDPASSVCVENGPRLFEKIRAGEIGPEEVGRMSEADLCPAGFRAEREEITARSEQKVVERTSAMWPCPVCHARAATYREVQDRAADEPASIYCTCTVCSHNYKPC